MAFLDPYRVIDLTDGGLLLAGRLLADLGADVIHVEPPTGATARRSEPMLTGPDGATCSALWQAYARNTRSVRIDLQTAGGRDAMLGLLANADVLIDAAAPATMDELGLGHAELQQRFPRLVHVSITPFGPYGPKAHYASTDLIQWAAGGALYPNREEGKPPVRPSVPQADFHAAGDAAGAAVLALLARAATGRGQRVDVAVQRSVAQATLSKVLAVAVGDLRPDPRYARPGGNVVTALDQSGSGSASGKSAKWEVLDGYVELHLAIGPATGRFTNNLFAWMAEELPEPHDWPQVDWTKVPAMVASGELAMEELERARQAVRAFLAPRSKATIFEASIARKLLAAPIATVADLAVSPQLAARDLWLDTTGECGQVRMPGRFARFSVDKADTVDEGRGAPALGQHDDELLDNRAAAPSSAKEVRNPINAVAASLPLEGVKVLDLTWVMAGPTLTRVLADYGATVVRVESSTKIDTARVIGPYHDGLTDIEGSAAFGNANAGKLGVSLDLSRDDARDVLRDLVRWCDVVVESFAPGVMTRWGLDNEHLRELNPSVVMLSTSLMGQSGPHATFAGFGNLGAAVAGFQEIIGWPDRPPFGPYGPYTDYTAPRFGLVALLSALDHRRRTGEGGYIDLAQVDSGVHFLAAEMTAYFADGRLPHRMGNRDLAMAPHGVYQCADAGGEEEWIAIAVRDDADWAALADVLEQPDLASHPDYATAAARLTHADDLDALLARWTSEQSAAALETQLQDAGVPAHKASASADFVVDTQLRATGHFVTLPHPRFGTTVVEGSRFHLSETPAVVRGPAPLLGQHTEQVLTELLGYSADRVAELTAAGALR